MVGTPAPISRQITAVMMSMTSTLPAEICSTKSVIIKPMPVSVITPTIRPALAQATPMPIMLREPSTSPVHRFTNPVLNPAAAVPVRRNRPSMAGWITTRTIAVAVAQNADVPGDNSSTIRHHSSTTMGMKKCIPARTVGHGSGRRSTGASGSSWGTSG